MNAEHLDIMLKTKKLKLSGSQKFWHYSPIILMLVPFVLAIWNLLEFYVYKTYDGLRTPEEIATGGFFLIPAVAIFYLQHKRLFFEEFKLNYSKEEFEESLEITAKNLDWIVDDKGEKFVVAHTNWNWSNSWGELITIINKGDKILINSICDPHAVFVSLFSYGRNRKNVKTFVNILKEIKIPHEK